jgi:hypothetical protein
MLKTARLITRRKTCPVCANRTDRIRTPRLLRWVKPLLGRDVSWRRCFACRSWRGLTIASVAPPGSPRSRPAPPVVLLTDDLANAAVLAAALRDRGEEVVVIGRSGNVAFRVRTLRPRLVLADEPGRHDGTVCPELRRSLAPFKVEPFPGRAEEATVGG